MTKPSAPDFFNKEAALGYDERNRRLAPIADCMHFLIRLVLRDLPTRSHVLCVGVGTGAEILSLTQAFPEWTFVAVDPSVSMLDVCRERLKSAGVLERCQLIHGYVKDAPLLPTFDVALSILVAHFIKREERLEFYQAMIHRLRDSGYLINTEISFDLDSQQFPQMLKGWEGIQSMMGATPESLAKLPDQLRNVLSVLPPEETENLLLQSGVSRPVRFFQALMICGWFGQKRQPVA